MLGNLGDFVGIDDLSLGDGSRALLEGNLRRHGLAGHAVLEGDAFVELVVSLAGKDGGQPWWWEGGVQVLRWRAPARSPGSETSARAAGKVV
jgi:hypothetical protein